jgi:hypothetical protein
MYRQTSIVLAAGFLLVSASMAPAAGTSQFLSTSKISLEASNTLNLTSTQRKLAWDDLKGQAFDQMIPPPDFRSAVGSTVPAAIRIQPVPSKAAADIPALKSYAFAIVQGKLLIVSPSDKKIAGVIAEEE